MSEERIISVRGVGRLSVQPDQISVNLCVKSEDLDYVKASAAADDDVRKLSSAVCSAGFAREDIKTSHFSVDCRYEYIRSDSQQIRQFCGYFCSICMSVTFPLDMQRLSRLLERVNFSEASPEISVSFGIKNLEEVSLRLLKSAAEDARKKAEVLAESSGMSLGMLRSVSYMPDSYPGNRMLRSMSIADAVPEDVVLSDSAEFVWELI